MLWLILLLLIGDLVVLYCWRRERQAHACSRRALRFWRDYRRGQGDGQPPEVPLHLMDSDHGLAAVREVLKAKVREHRVSRGPEASVVVLLLAAWAWVSPAHAQDLWYPQQNQVFIAIDLVEPALVVPPDQGFQQPTGWVFRTGTYLAGWAFNCNGTPPDISLWRYDTATGGVVRVPAVVTTGLSRPDVAAAYAGLPCTVTSSAGWHLYPTEPLPLGPQYLLVQGWASGGTWHPVTGLPIPASRWADRFVVILP